MALYLYFLKCCAVLFGIISLLSMCILLPLYITADDDTNPEDDTASNETTILVNLTF